MPLTYTHVASILGAMAASFEREGILSPYPNGHLLIALSKGCKAGYDMAAKLAFEEANRATHQPFIVPDNRNAIIDECFNAYMKSPAYDSQGFEDVREALEKLKTK